MRKVSIFMLGMCTLSLAILAVVSSVLIFKHTADLFGAIVVGIIIAIFAVVPAFMTIEVIKNK